MYMEGLFIFHPLFVLTFLIFSAASFRVAWASSVVMVMMLIPQPSIVLNPLTMKWRLYISHGSAQAVQELSQQIKFRLYLTLNRPGLIFIFSLFQKPKPLDWSEAKCIPASSLSSPPSTTISTPDLPPVCYSGLSSMFTFWHCLYDRHNFEPTELRRQCRYAQAPLNLNEIAITMESTSG